MPFDHLPVLACRPQNENEDSQPEQTDSSIVARVVLALRAGKCSHNYYSNDQSSAQRIPKPLRNELGEANAGVVPSPMHGLCHDRDWHMEEDEPQRDTEPEEEGYDPVLVVAVEDERRDPPSGP